MLRDVRRLRVPELGAFHEKVEVRMPSLRVSTQRGRNVASDYALVQRAAPFVHHLRRPQLVILLEGHARFDEGGKRVWFEAGTAMLSDMSRGGTDAFGGGRCRWLVLHWDPTVWGAPFTAQARVAPVDRRLLAQIDAAAHRLAGPLPAAAIVSIMEILRAWGLALAPATARDLEGEAGGAEDADVHAAVSAQLGMLETFPAISDLTATLGTNERRLHRRITAMARRYQLPWAHWRAALHHVRMLSAIRLLAAPGATTEKVARLTGFRAPPALCHAFDKAGLPSPGALARAVRGHALESWGDLVTTRGEENALQRARSSADAPAPRR